MNKDWKKAIKMKRKYAKQFAKNRTEQNWELKRTQRNEATKLRRRAIKEYWQEKTEHLKSKPNEFYKTFMPFLNSKRKVQNGTNISIKTNEKEIATDQNIVANILANYFATVADDIGGANVNTLTEDDLLNHKSIRNIEKETVNKIEFSFQPLSTRRVQTALEKLDVRKAAGYDLVTPKVLKIASSGIAESLTKLFNESILKGEWPEAWKKGEWCPVFKRDDRQDKKNYRPITLLCLVNKVYEQLLSEQVYEDFDSILDPNLTAYRKMHSCETTLIRLTEDWKLAADAKQYMGILSTDMSKAFDSLHHSLMLNKLRTYGFSEESLNLMRSYFTDRLNRVKLHSSVSDWKLVTRGCPQGSSFGPFLWNIFQNDLTYEVNDEKINLYADDHQLYVQDRCIDRIEQSLNNEGERMSNWYKDNFLKGNFDKYNVMIVGGRNKDIPALDIEIDGHNIKSTPGIRLLGVTLDQELMYAEHISEICKKTSKKSWCFDEI